MSSTVTTNLRIDRNEWLQIKSMAGEMGISVNEFIIRFLKNISTQNILGIEKNEESMTNFIADIRKIASQKNKPSSLSEEDKVIYEV